MGEVILGRIVTRNSPARMSKGKQKLSAAMREVHENIPSSVVASGKTGDAREAMLQAIAFSKARAAGARLPRKRRS